jgi:hypothetical protein
LLRESRSWARASEASMQMFVTASRSTTIVGFFMGKFLFGHKKSWSSLLAIKISKFPNGHGLKFLFLFHHYHPFCKLTMLNGWEKD